MNHHNDSNFRNRAMHEEKYNVTWHSYTDHLKSMMKELMMSEDFSDVTLVTLPQDIFRNWSLVPT